jgi:putative membrane protein
MPDAPTSTLPHASHAAEFLANERTFLAWVRTSIAVITLGFAVTKFDALMHEVARARPRHAPGWSTDMGIAMIVLGGLLPALAAWRYHVVNRQIERGVVRADRPLIGLVTVLVVALAATFVVYFQRELGSG